MNHATQVALIERALAHVDGRTTDMADSGGSRQVTAYTDPERLDRELQQLFRSRPIICGHISQLAQPGDYLTHDAAGIPLLLTRDDDGELRGFLNVCRHRGTRLVMERCGQARAFVCPYHAWSYSNDGRLLGVPHKGGFADLLFERRGLIELAVDELAGFLFVRPTAGERPNAAELLGPLADDLLGYGLADHVVHAPTRIEGELNWKLVIDVFLEAYHLKTTHKTSIYPMFFDNLGLVDNFAPHLRNVFPKRSITELRQRDRADWRLRDHANVLYYLFPNTLILMEPDHAGVLHVFPRGADGAVIHAYSLIPEPATSDKARAYWQKNNDILYAAIAEDLEMGESIQSGLASGANQELLFGRFEHALSYFHAAVDAALEAD